MDPNDIDQDVTLRDGRVVHLRAIRASDEAEILQAFEQLGPDARYMRFMRPVPTVNLDRLRKTLASFPESGIGIVATVPAADGFDIAGSTILMLDGGASRGEFAISVTPQYGGTGLATALMKSLIDAAKRRGVKELEGYVLAQNASMLRLAARLGFGIAPDPNDSTVRLCRLRLDDEQPSTSQG
jgi:acetyltransferase